VIAVALSLVTILVGTVVAYERTAAYRRAKLGRLISKYNSAEIANRIFHRQVWQGQTEKQLLDSRGEPINKQRMLRDPQSETWTYNPRGLNRYCFQVTLKDGVVIAFDGEAD